MSESPDDLLSEFPVTISQPVQWGEQDGFGHVNNMHFIRWFESARIAYLTQCEVPLQSTGGGPILAAVSCNYRRQLKYPDVVIVGTRVTKIGRTSLTVEHQLWSQSQNALAADGDSTIVMFDYDNQVPFAVSLELRTRIENLEGKSLS